MTVVIEYRPDGGRGWCRWPEEYILQGGLAAMVSKLAALGFEVRLRAA